MIVWQRWLTVSALALTLASPGAAAADTMDGMQNAAGAGTMAAKIDYSKTDVRMKDGVELVALRALAESLGYQVAWNDSERSVTLTHAMRDMGAGMGDKDRAVKPMGQGGMTDKNMAGIYTVTIAIGSKTATAAMKERMLADAPVLIDSKTYVSKAFVEMYLVGHRMMMK